jgi:hypothetical protein
MDAALSAAVMLAIAKRWPDAQMRDIAHSGRYVPRDGAAMAAMEIVVSDEDAT